MGLLKDSFLAAILPAPVMDIVGFRKKASLIPGLKILG